MDEKPPSRSHPSSYILQLAELFLLVAFRHVFFFLVRLISLAAPICMYILIQRYAVAGAHAYVTYIPAHENVRYGITI